ncbi:hypothetical protein EMCRGX_G013751 [Ephydatia muelleri]
MRVVVAYCFFSLLLLIAIGCHGGVAPKSETLYLLSLLSYPDPSGDPSLRPSVTNGGDIIPGAKLAIQEINNRTDILTNYKLELIVADDGCNISWKSIISLINNLYYEGKHIVGIIGPQCSDSTKAVASLTGQSEIALINVHLGSAPELGNRSLYPYSFGINPPTSNTIDALVALFVRNNWTRAAVLYNPDMLVDYNSFRMFQNKISGKAELSLVSPANPDYLPLVALKSTFVRVIVAFLRGETLGRVLCVAYRMGMTYPNYQWLLLGSYLTFPKPFVYNSTLYSCNETDEDKQTLQFQSNAYQQYNTTRYTQLSADYVQNGVCANNVINFVALFDAVWAYAVALNNSIYSLGEIGLTLSNYTFGKEKFTQIILHQMYRLNFSGVVGNIIRFDPLNGYISSVLTYVLNVNSDIVANYTISDGIQIDTAVAVFVATDFEVTHILVSLPLAVVIIVVDVIGVLLVLGIHVMNTVYRNHKAIKASSSRLNHFAYIGCYLILLATLLYTITETFPVNMQSKSILCNAFPWSLIIGLTLVFGAVTAKTWRLYYIFKSSQKLRSGYNAVMSDSVLAVLIVILVVIVAGFCTAWTVHDPYVRTSMKRFMPSGYTLSVTIEEFCSCKYQVQWIASIIAFETIFIVLLVYFAISTRALKKKEFQTRSIIVLVYLLSLTTVVGGVIYLIAKIVEAGVDSSYGILASLLTVIVYLCIVLFFTPPILPVIDELLHPHRQRITTQLTIRTLIRTETAVSRI